MSSAQTILIGGIMSLELCSCEICPPCIHPEELKKNFKCWRQEERVKARKDWVRARLSKIYACPPEMAYVRTVTERPGPQDKCSLSVAPGKGKI